MIVVVGGGVAGLSCVLAAVAADAPVTLVLPEDLSAHTGAGNTPLAQGGIAAALAADDSPAAHLADTLAAGAGLVDVRAAELLTSSGQSVLLRLLAAGYPAGRAADGSINLGLEAAHGHARIVHAGGDRSGAELHTLLIGQVRAYAAAGRVLVRSGVLLDRVLVSEGQVAGVSLRSRVEPIREHVRAQAVVLATGGYAAVYPRTSNAAGARGSGILAAARVGAAIADLEFVQFHPTVLVEPDATSATTSGTGAQLISEAVRGAGAQLRDSSGQRFLLSADPRGELAPRDIVAREIHRVLRDSASEAVFLDARMIERDGGPGALARRFPGIHAALRARGIDWRRELVPVAPAAHYSMGGIAVDTWGRSSVPGLFAVGEAAATGVHGANRLASNSLLEGLVFGERIGAVAARLADQPDRWSGAWHAWARGDAPGGTGNPDGAGNAGKSGDGCELAESRAFLAHPGSQVSVDRHTEVAASHALASGAGIERDAAGLRATAAVCAHAGGVVGQLGLMLCTAATAREESRGAHQRSDFPATRSVFARRRAVVFPGIPDFPGAPAPGTQLRQFPEDSVRIGALVPRDQRSWSPC